MLFLVRKPNTEIIIRSFTIWHWSHQHRSLPCALPKTSSIVEGAGRTAQSRKKLKIQQDRVGVRESILQELILFSQQWDRLNGELWSGELSRRVMISESYVQTTPTFPNDHTQFLNSPDVPLNWHERVMFDVTLSLVNNMKMLENYHFL